LTKNHPILTIVTITKNDKKGFSRTLRSLEEFIQNSLEIEWVIINAGKIFKVAPKSISNYQVINKSDSGPFAGMNKGLLAANGLYVNFLNSGDEVLSDCKSEVFLKELSQIQGVWAVADALKEVKNGYIKWRTPVRRSLRFLLGLNSFPHQATFYRTDSLRATSGFNEQNLVADYETSLRFLEVEHPKRISFTYSRNSMGGISDKIKPKDFARDVALSHQRVHNYRGSISVFIFLVVYLSKRISLFRHFND
jgi:hypothetical protein